MTQTNNRTRAKSARPHTQRQRPLSSKPNHGNDKTGFIQKIYTNIPVLQDRPSSGKQKNKMNSLYLPYHMTSNGGAIQKEALQQENMQLKKKVNLLQEELAQMYGKIQASRSKNAKLKRNLNVQFQNQSLWTGSNAYLVTGVKNQYQKLKSQHRQKCEQLNQLKQTNMFTVMKQLQKQNETLKRQNTRLLQIHVEQQNKNSVFNNSTQFVSASGRQHRVNEMMATEREFKLSQIEDKLIKRNQQIFALQKNFQQDNSKVKFLQKLIIEKDNSLHAFKRRKDKLQLQKEVYLQQLQAFDKKANQAREQNQQKVQKILQNEQKRVTKQREIYSKSIEQKNFTINKLEKEVAYLTTLMSYWKPLDEQKRKPESPKKQANNAEIQQKAEEEKKRKAAKLSESLSIAGKVFSQRMAEDDLQRQKAEEAIANQVRHQKRADVKRSETAKKVRRVKDSEVEEIGELIKFRLIAQRISIDTAKDYFNHVSNSQLSEDQQQWQGQYIPMTEAFSILRSSPFSLTEQQAHLLSRYMVQDVMNDYIYCDEENQNKREIVKSILKNLLKDYSLDKDLADIQTETNVELQKYKGRISTILQQLYKDGLINKKKLVEIFVGSGFDIRQDILDFIVGKLAMQSENLERLKYRVLF